MRTSRIRLFQLVLCAAALTVSGISWAQTEESSTTASDQPAEPAASTHDNLSPSITLKGSVWRMRPGIVFLRTAVGPLTLSSSSTLKDVRGSHEVRFWVHGPHMAVEIRKRTDGSLVHRYLSGPFTPTQDGAMQMWMPEGEQTIRFGSQDARLSGRRPGDPVTVEVDEAGTALGLHDLQFDLQVGQVPSGSAEPHLLLDGTVAKLKSSFIFFRTPVGIVNVNAKIGIKNAKVGQRMTLHVHHRAVVAELAVPQTDTPAHRFVTGPLEFATPDRTSITLWTPEGAKTFATDRGATTLAGLPEGTPITVELDATGAVVAFHRVN